MVNSNPIQQVLQAEREAGEAIEKARNRSEQAIVAARRWAQDWDKRTELRLKKATTRYAKEARGERQQETQTLRERASQDIARRRALAESQLERLVEEIYAQRWPKA